jgi:hypothetical protein
MPMAVAVDVPEETIPTNASEWSELVVKEMSSASDLADAKKRAFRILELFEKSTVQIGPDSKSIQEHKVVKQMLGSLLHQNGVLKRAVLIQHNRLKDYEEMEQEHSQFKQIIENYQEQIKALEVSFLFFFSISRVHSLLIFILFVLLLCRARTISCHSIFSKRTNTAASPATEIQTSSNQYSCCWRPLISAADVAICGSSLK